MPNYQQGKIYKIIPTNTDDDICYVGSTTRPLLCQRMEQHRKGYKYWKKDGKGKKISSFELFEIYGIDNCVIELIEIVPCNSKDELNRREGYYIRLLNCVNKNIAGRTYEEWYDANRDLILENRKEYREANRDTILEKNKEYREANRDTILEEQRKYREANREKILEKKKGYYDANRDTILKNMKEYYDANREKLTEKYTCICGLTLSKRKKRQHERSQKHINYCASVSVVP